MSKMIFEKQKLKDKSQYRAISWLSKLGKFIGYLSLALAILSFVTPMIAMNYISNQIKSGEWGADFIPKNVTKKAEEIPIIKNLNTDDDDYWRNYFEEDGEEVNSWFEWVDTRK